MAEAREKLEDEMASREEEDLDETERYFRDAGLQHVGVEKARKLTNFDCISIVRGYESYDPREAETNRAFEIITDWREKNGYDKFLKERLPQDDVFHGCWEETAYGADKYGHMIVGMQVGNIDADGLSEIAEDHVAVLQGQKMTALTQYKYLRCQGEGKPRRYKHILICNLKGVGLSIVSGKKRAIMQRLMKEVADVFPESVHKIFMVNAPMIFRAGWAIVKPWVHPITQAKINICGSESQALKMFAELGITKEQLPAWIGGTNPGKTCLDIIKDFTSGELQVLVDPIPEPPAFLSDAVDVPAKAATAGEGEGEGEGEAAAEGQDEAVEAKEQEAQEEATATGGELGRKPSLAPNGQQFSPKHITSL
eukprot:m.203321 g.203321  ORF g.203321 m.203321 type:complete len:367 (-) comp18453_c0_seq2:2387-3487(-)